MALQEDDDVQLKRYEHLLEYSKATFEFYLKRWDESDAKVGRFVTMLLALGAAGVFNIRRVVTIVAQDGWLAHLWIEAYVLFAVSAVLSFCFFFRSLSYQRITAPIADQLTVVPFFDNTRYVDTLIALSKSYLNSAQEASACLDKSLRAAFKGFVFFVAALIFGLLSAIGYATILLEARNAGTVESKQPTAGASAVTSPTAP